MIETMYVIKRSGDKEAVAFEKVQHRIAKSADGLAVNAVKVAQGVLARIVDGITTTELDTITANLAFSWCTTHPDYGTLAARIAISNHQKNTPATMLDCVNRLDAVRDNSGTPASLLDPALVACVREHAAEIEARIDYNRDFLLDFFGFKTLERAYLLRDTKRVVVERPQHMWMRVALGLWHTNLEKAFETYDMISQKYYTHATPTLFNAGTKKPQLSSCFLMGMKSDSIHGIYDTLKDCALISQYGGGIGIHTSNIRAQGSLIKGTGGVSNGIVPMLRVFNNTARYVDQCFAPETLVYTDRGPQRIEMIRVGDRVLSSDGNFHRVRLPVRHNYSGDILQIYVESTNEYVRVTPEHQIMVLTHGQSDPEFVDACDLRVGDQVVYPVSKDISDNEYLSYEDCWMYGHVHQYGIIHVNSIELPSNSERALAYLNQRGISYNQGSSGIVWSVANPGWKFTVNQFMDLSSRISHIDPSFFHLPDSKLRAFAEGFGRCDTVPESERLYLELCLRKDREFLTFPIVSIEKRSYSGIVHDFEVDSPHDYTTVGLGVAHNGGGKRNGSFAMYLEPWHADVEAFLEMKKNTGAEEERARDLFYALWVPDLFMERVDANGDWTLFCPNEAPGLADAVGDEFKALYERYEAEGRGRKTVKAQTLWFQILDSQIETGTPYLLYKDAANRKSNQQNLGTIKSSNLCVAPETLVLTREGEFPIVDLHGKEIEVWNGEKWSSTRVEQTGHNQPVIGVDIVVCSMNGDTGAPTPKIQHIECTPYHKFLVKNRVNDDVSIKTCPRKEAKDLQRGDCLLEWMSPDGDILEAIVWDVLDYKRTCNTYCFNEPENHAGVFNGILTGNCTEIIEYSSPEETAVCNLASLALPSFVKDGAFDFKHFRQVVKTATYNLNQVIDINYYPIPEAKVSNMRHRPIGLGVQGLADVFAMLGYPWESIEAADLNKRIFAHMYYAALEASCDLAAKEGSYETFAGSPASKGDLQFALWGIEPLKDDDLDWDQLINAIRRIGLRNSLLVAPMPTASTSQILGNCECFEPYATHIFTRRTLAGEFIVVNKHLVTALLERGLWSDHLKNQIIANNGSVQGLSEVPADLQAIFKTVWEIKQKTLIDMAADRGPYICQSQSLNLFLGDPDYRKLTSMHFYAWRKGLKTGIYYLRTRAVASAQKFTVDPTMVATAAASSTKKTEEPAECLMCSS